MKTMTHADVQKMMGDVYNGFYVKWTKNPPSKDPNDPGWGLMQRELNDILERYSDFTFHGEGFMWNPAAEIGVTLMQIINDRVRGLAD